MRSKQKHNDRPSVGLVFARVHRGASLSIWPVIADECARRGVNLFCFAGGQVGSMDPYETSRNAVYAVAAEAPLDGVLVWASALSGTGPESEIDRLVGEYRDIPAIGISAGVYGIPSVTIDFYSGMRAAVEHMLDVHGYSAVGFIRGPEKHPSAEDRYRAYLDLFRDRGMAADERLVTTPRDWDGGAEAVSELLDERGVVPGRELRALVVASDLLALKAMIALQGRGIRVPEDVAVIGMNDIIESRVASPPLSSVHAPFSELGAVGLSSLLDLMDGKAQPPERRLPTRLVVRRSCGCPAGAVHYEAGRAAEADTGSGERILSAVGLSAGTGSELLDPVLGSWRASLDRGDFSGFFDRLTELVDHLVRNRMDIAPWQAALAELKRSLGAQLSPGRRIDAESAIARARAILDEGAIREVNFRAWEENRRAEEMGELNHALLTALDMNRLSQILIPALTRFGIGSAYVCRYARENDFTEADLVFAFRDGEEVSDPALRFPVSDLVPKEKFPDRRLAYIVQPLYFHETPIGYVLLEIGPRSGVLYEELRNAISNALRTIILFARIESARAAAERSNLIKTRLLSNVSHELRAPVQQILRCIDRLSEKVGADDRDLRAIAVNAEHQRRLVGDLLDISRAEIDELDIRRELVDIEPAAREVFAEFAASANSGVEWSLEIPEKLPLIQVDPIRFRQILFNLLGNAAKFTEAGRIRLRLETEAPDIVITVADTGPGIPADRQAFVFEPFISSDSQRTGAGGVGLGLSITRHLVSLHFGTISAESRPGEGAVFRVRLPLPNLDGGALPSAPPPEGGCLLLVSADGPGEDLAAVAERNRLPIRRVSLEEAERGELENIDPAAIAWDLSAAGGAEWSLFRKIRQHPRLASRPFLLYGAAGLKEKTAGFLDKNAAEPTLSQAIMLCCPLDGDAPVLVADDDPAELEFLRGVVLKTVPGLEVIAAADGDEAWEAVRKRRPRLAVLDLMMPGLSGFDILDLMRADDASAKIPVLLRTNKVITAEDVRRLEERSRVLLQNKGVWTEEDLAAGISRVLYGGADRLPQPTSVVVKRAVAYLNEHYRSNITRWKLADAVNVSEYYLSRIFHGELGVTVWEYLTRLRIHRAKELLKASDESVAVVGEKVGFPDQAYFSRVFRKTTGTTPNAYRDSARR